MFKSKRKKTENVEVKEIAKKKGKYVYLDKNVLRNHLILFGRTGAGKTVLFKRLYSQLKAEIMDSGEKSAIITHAIKDDLIAENFIEGKDYLLNPYDVRGSDFNIMALIEDEKDITAIATAAMNATGSKGDDDKFWLEGGKDIFVGLLYMALYEVEEAEENGVEIILNNFLLKRLKNLGIVEFAKRLDKVKEKYPRANSAFSRISIVLSDQTNKTAKSFWDFFDNGTKFLDVIREENNNREIDLDQLINDPTGETVYLANFSDIKEEVAPYLTIFITSMIRKLLAKPEGHPATLYLFLDELGNLGKIEKLDEFITLARSKGGGCLIANQDIPRLEKIYGKEEFGAIIESCATNIFMNVGKDSSKYAEELIGEQQKQIIKQGHSTATYSEKDSKSVNEEIVTEKTVLASQINNLKTHEFYFKTIGTDWIHVRGWFDPDLDLFPQITEGYIKTEAFKINARKKVLEQKAKKVQGEKISSEKEEVNEIIEEKPSITNEESLEETPFDSQEKNISLEGLDFQPDSEEEEDAISAGFEPESDNPFEGLDFPSEKKE